MASKYDIGWFEDDEELTAFMADQRIADTRMSSSFADAASVIEDFAASEDAGAWPSLDRAMVAERLRTLIAPAGGDDGGTGYRSLSQAGLNLCGPASLLLMAMGRDPVAVARYATQLFDTGTGAIGGFSVTAGDTLREADFANLQSHGSTSSQAEWLMMSAIRNATEPFWQPKWTGNPEQELAGMTRPEEVADWMRQTGIWSRVKDNGKWASNPGIPDATSQNVAEGTDTALLVHANLIKESRIIGSDASAKEHSWSIDEYFPNHWVVLLTDITPQNSDGSLKYSIWTWGGRLRLHTPQQTFLDSYFGTVSASL